MTLKEDGDRQKWGRNVEFLLAIIGYSVGMGNVWRFPYTCYESGGGAFLVAYLIMWTLCGVPLLYMELAVGQYTRLGPVGAMSKLCPLLKGIAVGSVVFIAIARTLYLVLLVWPIYYLINSFKEYLPWASCGHSWNTPACFDGKTFLNETNGTDIKKISTFGAISDKRTISASAEFFRNHVLQTTSGIDNLGIVRLEFALILLLAWIIIYFAIFKGTKSIGKIVYVTVLFSYCILLVFIVRGFLLPGSLNGIMFLLTPKWEKLAEPKVWVHAASTNFFSLGISTGGNITLASFNKQRGKILKFAIFIALVDLLSSLMAGVAVFTNLGYLVQYQGKELDEVVKSGMELVFIVFPEIFTTMPLSQLFSVLFYLMIITLVLDTLLVGPEIVATALTDQFKNLPRREILVAAICLTFYLLAFPTITQGGIYYFALMDYYLIFGSSVSLAFLEVVALSWLYGARKLSKNIREISGSPPHLFFLICWYIISPLIIIAIWIFSIVKYQPYTFGSYHYPQWAVGLAWMIASLPLICVPMGMIHSLYIADASSVWERLRISIRPKTDRILETKYKLVEITNLA